MSIIGEAKTVRKYRVTLMDDKGLHKPVKVGEFEAQSFEAVSKMVKSKFPGLFNGVHSSSRLLIERLTKDGGVLESQKIGI